MFLKEAFKEYSLHCTNCELILRIKKPKGNEILQANDSQSQGKPVLNLLIYNLLVCI